MPHDGMNPKVMRVLKEVGASGQISLGKKYAGRLFEVEDRPDGTIVMRPVRVIADPAPRAAQDRARYDAGQSEGAEATRRWAHDHEADIDRYNEWAALRLPYSQRVRRWREQGSA